MSDDRRPLPSEIFDEIVSTVRDVCGEKWLGNERKRGNFVSAMTSVIDVTDGVHLMGKPETEDDLTTFNVWIDFQVNDLWDADELAYAVFSQIGEDIFLTCREIHDGTVRYRFLTGTMSTGHMGVLTLAGPNAKEFADLYLLKSTDGGMFHA